MPRFPRYSLRTLLFLTAAVAVLLGWGSLKAEKQRRAVATLEGHSAVVGYNYPPYFSREYVPAFKNWRYRANRVYLFRPPSESDIAALQALDGLEAVYTNNLYPEELDLLRKLLPKCRVY
ncbi:MAG: hypothetical protein K8T91_04735 [Planctomycetes bacterium]|nr:hypothetical protein [Planctomycetota bacterium]